jgi:hypothetical protein
VGWRLQVCAELANLSAQSPPPTPHPPTCNPRGMCPCGTVESGGGGEDDGGGDGGGSDGVRVRRCHQLADSRGVSALALEYQATVLAHSVGRGILHEEQLAACLRQSRLCFYPAVGGLLLSPCAVSADSSLALVMAMLGGAAAPSTLLLLRLPCWLRPIVSLRWHRCCSSSCGRAGWGCRTLDGGASVCGGARCVAVAQLKMVLLCGVREFGGFTPTSRSLWWLATRQCRWSGWGRVRQVDATCLD